MTANRTPDDRHATTTKPPCDIQVRHVVIADRSAVLGLTENAIPATTFRDLISQPAETVAGWLGGERAVVVDDGGWLASAAIAKLQCDRLPTVIISELRDPDRNQSE